ncbi:MAG: outer membrane lipoprotein carrier protein LolA [Pseudomonadota bacterium]
MKLSRRLFGIALLGFGLAAQAAFAKLSLGEISAYVNGIQSAQSTFTQINSNGSQTTGQIYIKRPGKMRFEYDPPNKALVLASSGRLSVHDGRSNTRAKIYPLKKTPINVILERTVDFSKDALVVAHESKGAFTHVTLRDPKRPELGQAELIFSNSPVALRQWIITDRSNRRTTLLLDDLQKKSKLPNKLFRIENSATNNDN